MGLLCGKMKFVSDKSVVAIEMALLLKMLLLNIKQSLYMYVTAPVGRPGSNLGGGWQKSYHYKN